MGCLYVLLCNIPVVLLLSVLSVIIPKLIDFGTVSQFTVVPEIMNTNSTTTIIFVLIWNQV